MRRERGLIEPWMIGALLGVVALIGLFVAGQMYLAHVEEKGFKVGAASVQAKWDAASLKAEADKKELTAAVAGALDVLAGKVKTAEAEAARHKANWEGLNRANRGKQLGSCEGSGSNQGAGTPATGVAGAPAGDGAGQAGVAGGDRGIRLLWRFVGLYDGAHSDGVTGQPLFGATQAYALASERANTASPYGLGELIDQHSSEAGEWAKCRRDLNTVIGEVEAAEASYEAKLKAQR